MIENDFGNETAASTGTERAADLRERAGEVFQKTKEQAGEVLGSGEVYVRENPMTFVLLALVGGFLLGLVFGPRRRSLNERYIAEPVERSGGAMVAAALALAALGRRVFKSMSSASHEAVASSRDFAKPVKRAMKTARRKMHIG
jgi:hypothetical protein